MAFDIFLQLGDIRGESMRREFAGQIDVLSYSWDLADAATADGARAAPTLTITKYLDAASPLIVALHRSQQAVDAVLVGVKPSGREVVHEYLRLTLNGARVTACTTSGSQDGDRPIEMITLVARSWKITVRPQDMRGDPMDAIEYGFDAGGVD